MKKMMKFFGFVAVAAMSLTACQNDIVDEQVNNNEGVTLEIIADAPTRSAFGELNGNAFLSTWTGDESVRFVANGGTAVNVTPDSAGATTRFEVTFTDGTDVEDGTIYAMSPVGDYKTDKGGWGTFYSNYGYVYLTVPTTQTPLENSVDEAAHVLFAEHKYEGAFPTSSANVQFKHALAYGKMTLKMPEGVEIANVAITFPSAVAGPSIKYYHTAYGDYQAGDYTSANQNTITLLPTNVKNNVFWFGIQPIGTLTGNTDITVTATDGQVYTKTIETADEIAFERGRVLGFTVNMTAVAPATYEYALISNISELTDGSEVIIVGKTTTKTAALGAANGSSSAPGLDEVTLVDNTVDMSTVLTTSILTVTKTDAGYKFGNGSAYLYATNTNNGIRFGTNSNNVFTVSTHGSNSDAFMMKNNAVSRFIGIYNNQDWRCYTTYNANNYIAATGTSELYIYKKGIAAVDNREAQTLTFSASEVSLTMGDTFTAPTLEGLKTTATWESSNTDVATVVAETGAVTIVGPGTTIIKVTAEESERYKAATASYTLNVEQASIEKLTVAQFKDKEVNNAVYYELTGTISNIASTTYGNFDLTDATGTIYIYGLTQEKVDNNDQSFADIGLVDGDQVTIHTCRAAYGTTPQGGGTPPAYYISHVVNTTSRIISVSPSALTFTYNATDAQDVTVTVAGDAATLYATADQTWVTATPLGNTVSVTVEENTVEESREANITINYGESTKTVTVTQTAKPAEGAPVEQTVEIDLTNVWSAKTDFTEGTTYTLKEGILDMTFKQKNNSSTSNYYGSGQMRLYKNDVFTFSSTKNLKSVVFTCTGANYSKTGTVSTGSHTSSNSVVTWTASNYTTKSFDVTLSGSAWRITGIVVTYYE